MIQPIYTSVSNANIAPCGKKGLHISGEPIPLLRNNYLGEYRTELEKAKVRKNLGIADDVVMEWGNISGHIEQQQDLIDYINSIQAYTNSVSESISTVKQALDYSIEFIRTFKSEHEEIVNIHSDIKNIRDELNVLDDTIELYKQELNNTIQGLESSVNDKFNQIDSSINDIIGLTTNNYNNINALDGKITGLNNLITKLNDDLSNINVDTNIKNWITSNISSSNTLELSLELNILEVKISNDDENAIQISNGLYVKDFSSDISELLNISNSITEVNKYLTELGDATMPNTIGGIIKGTKASELLNKTMTEILDLMLFPSYTRPLVEPMLYYSNVPTLVKVGSDIVRPQLIFIKGDAGEEIIDLREDILLEPSGIETTTQKYNELGAYTYKGKVYYLEGEELLNNRNEPSGYKIPEGYKEASYIVNTTYPWYTSDTDGNEPKFELPLVKFGNSGEIEFSLTGKALIWLPGSNSTFSIFLGDVGFGYKDIDLKGWSDVLRKEYKGIIYNVWTKIDPYVSANKHKIKFTLAL